jgi:hypothetical protein
LRAQRGVEAPANASIPEASNPEPKAEEPASGSEKWEPVEKKENPNPAQKEKPTPDMIALARSEKAEAQRMRDEALAAKAATEARLNSLKDDPMGFLAELGMTEADWVKFNQGGGVPPAIAKSLRELQQGRESDRKQLAEMQARAQKAEEDRDIGGVINQFPLVRKLGGADAARAHLAAMKQRGENPGTWQEVMQSLEGQFSDGLSNIFADSEINAKYKFRPSQHQAPAATTPTTLGTQHTSGGNYLEANAKNPFPVGTPQNLEWKRNRAQAHMKGAIK